jgi:ectoine hydroxylase-related dioxygenase (phytanoyl-CoA dioxygenase family)
MGTRDLAVDSRHVEAVDWAQQHFAIASVEPIVDAPWSTTYRLLASEESAYLKIVPAHQAAVLAATAVLAARFSRHLPKVLAVDPVRGWMLSAAHAGRTLDYDSPDEELTAVARAYAGLQAQAAREPALLAGLPKPDIAALLRLLLEFLHVDGADASGRVRADYFLGQEQADRYRKLVERHLGLLQDHLAAAAALPATFNHGDLRPPNTALESNGTCVFLDWDDAIVGPAGMSLHGLFGGVAVPTILLSDSPAAQAAASGPPGQRIHSYVRTLAEAGYADEATLRCSLPAAMCAGVIQFILNFARFPGESARSAVRGTMRRRLRDLIDLCDTIAARQPSLAFDLIRDYEAAGELRRAQSLLQDQVTRHPGRADLLAHLGRVCLRRDELPEAEEVMREAVDLTPHDPALRLELAEVLTARLELGESRQQIGEALRAEPGSSAARAALAHVDALERMREDARLPGRMPILRFEPRAPGKPARVRTEEIALGAELFNTWGTLQIDNAFPLELIERLQATFFERYAAYFHESDHPDALWLGDKRYMLTVDTVAPFDDPELIGAPTVLPIIRRILGDDCVLGAFTSVISLPGSRDQRLHKDHPALFPGTDWHFTLPSFAAQIIIPLVPLDGITGTTRFYKGSHRIPTDEAEATGHQDPQVPLGSCLINDYRCAHRGLGNRSDRVRPILTLIYNRPWFHDYKNYGKQPPLRISDATYAKLPADLKPLLAWWKEERKVVALDQVVQL